MAFDKRRIRSISTLNFRLRQVVEQTVECDLTIKKGQWEKKYHRCVLKASPFFDCILKNDFLENHTGIMNITGWTPASIDMALMYLYGEEPEFNNRNIEDMLDLAEFFMIPNLKSACVYWLNSRTISKKNCLSWLQLSSIYDFELPQCIAFIESHLDTVFDQHLCISLTYESLVYIFKEETFCYLHMTRRLQFLISWYKAQPENRRQLAEQLLETIAFDDIPTTSLHEIKRDPVAEEMLQDVNFQYVDEKFDVLINETINDGVIICFDFRRKRWFKITSSALKDKLKHAEVVGTNSEVSEILLAHNEQWYNTHTLFKLRLDKDELKKYELVIKDSETGHHGFDAFHFSNNLCVIICNVFKNNEVLIGEFVDVKVEIVPQFSIADCRVLSVTTNKSSVAALVSSRGHVFVYDTVECTLDKLDIKTRQGDKIFSTENGFVIHDNKRCISIKKMSGHSLSARYKKYEYNLHKDIEHYGNIPQYYFCNNIWYRYVRLPSDFRLRFQRADHDVVAEAPSPDYVKWIELTLPDEKSYYFGKSMYLGNIPRLLQLCHIHCPHCKDVPSKCDWRHCFIRKVSFADIKKLGVFKLRRF